MNDSQPSKSKRRWYRFSLRTLLVVILLLCVLLGWFALKMRQAERQRRAVEAIRKAGGTVLYDYQFHEESGTSTGVRESPVPTWLRELMGEDFFASVAAVGFHDPESSASDTRPTTVDDPDAVLEHVAGLTGVVCLWLDANQVTDAGMEHLRGLTRLRYLDLSYTQVTDAGLENLNGLTQLYRLELNGTQVTDAGLEHFKGLTELGLLQLHGTDVTEEGSEELRKALPDCHISWVEEAGPPPSARPDSPVVKAWENAGFLFGWMCRIEYGFRFMQLREDVREDDMPGFFQEAGLPIKSLQGLPPPSVPFGVSYMNVTDAELKELTQLKQLRSLFLLGAQVTNAGLKELAGLTELRWLELSDAAHVTDEGLKELARLKQLQTLDLMGVQVTDAGLKELAGLTQLESLNLSDTQVTDAGLKELAELTQLQELALIDSLVTDEGVKNLQQALPDCEIHH